MAWVDEFKGPRRAEKKMSAETKRGNKTNFKKTDEISIRCGVETLSKIDKTPVKAMRPVAKNCFHGLRGTCFSRKKIVNFTEDNGDSSGDIVATL